MATKWKRKRSAKKAVKTRKTNIQAAAAKKEATLAKRTSTIESNKKADEKAKARKVRAKKFNEFTSKPIVWLFALFGWGHALYYLIELVVLVLRALGYM